MTLGGPSEEMAVHLIVFLGGNIDTGRKLGRDGGYFDCFSRRKISSQEERSDQQFSGRRGLVKSMFVGRFVIIQEKSLIILSAW